MFKKKLFFQCEILNLFIYILYFTVPTITHWTATKRLLWYLKKTIFQDIHIKKAAAHCLTTYSDIDWVGSIDDKTSTLDDITFLGCNPISWGLEKQRVVARSTTEAEYRTLANDTSETMWLLALLHELGFSLKVLPSLLCDKSWRDPSQL